MENINYVDLLTIPGIASVMSMMIALIKPVFNEDSNLYKLWINLIALGVALILSIVATWVFTEFNKTTVFTAILNAFYAVGLGAFGNNAYNSIKDASSDKEELTK